ncbi:MAG: restriction endonuclease subunit S [Burkholderiales bacterium]|nr:restriction endonuclease subunit S [Burkholderiales bacterium]
MKQGWELKKLGDVCEISTGKSNTEDAIDNGDYAFFDRSKVIKKSSKYLFDCDAIIVAGEGQTFLPKFYSGKFDLHQRAYAIFNFDKTVNINYAYKYLIHFHKYFEEVAVGATAKSLRLRHFQDLPIPIAPLPEQQKIVSILDKAFSAIEQVKQHAEQNLNNAKELFNNYLQSIFTNKGDDWEDKNIGDICNLMTGGTPSSNKAEYYNNGKIRWLVSGDVNMIEIHDCKGRITELGLANSNTKFLPVNSVIIALNGQGKTRGTVAILRTKATCNQSLVSIYPKDIEKLLPEFIFYNLKVRYQELRTITGDSGNDRRGLNMPLIRSISIPYPKSIQDQEKLIKTFSILSDKTKQLEDIYQQKLNELEELKKSILQKSFKGELN